MLQIISPVEKVTAPEIVWRNPNPVHRHPKRHSFERAGECARYVLQEFVMDGQVGYWAKVSDLEVLVGGRAA
jgi:hypothetical protein